MLERIDEGRGDLVLLLHSGGMSSRQWRKLIAKLSPRYRVIAPDFLGSGSNPPWPEGEPFTFTQDVDAVRALLVDAGGPAHVVGHSYGGLIALKVALAVPDHVRSLALYDPVAFGVLYGPADEEGLADLARAEKNPVFRDPARGGSEAWLTAFVDYWNGDGAWRAMPEASRQSFLRVGRKVFMEVATLTDDRTPAAAYARIDVPALFLIGEHSPAAARRLSKILADALPRGSLREIAGQGHMGPILAADAVNDLIAAHLLTTA